MITFETETTRFTYRVAGVVIDDGHVLLEYTERYDFWYMPGGRCELLEPSNETLRREMSEELGVEVPHLHFLWVVENFFIHRGKAGHELAFYYRVTLPPDPALLAKDAPIRRHDERGHPLFFRWFPLHEIAGLELYPTFLKHRVPALAEALDNTGRVEHVLHTHADDIDRLAEIRRTGHL